MIPALSTEVYSRLFQALQEVEEFETHQQLCEFIATGELAVYHAWFLRHEYQRKEERIEKTIHYLRRQRMQGKQLVLPILLLALCKTLSDGDLLRNELQELAKEVERELKQPPFSRKMESLTLETPEFLFHAQNGSSASSLAIEPLQPDDREWIIQLVSTIIDPMGADGRKNLLRSCCSDERIGRIAFDEGTRNVAEAMIGLLENMDRISSSQQSLERFFSAMIENDYFADHTIIAKLTIIITTYTQKRKQLLNLSRSYNHLHLQVDSPAQEPIPITQQLQIARDQYQTKPAPSPYKIDAGTIIQYNLHEQKSYFWNGFDGRYKGIFTFTVGNLDRRILKEYVIEGLIWELKQRIKNPIAPVRHVYLTLEKLDCSSLEQGIVSLQREIQQQLSIKSFTDLLDDDQETNVVLVIWHRDIPPHSLKHVALQFSENLKESVKDLLYQHGRCLVIFWATHGFPASTALDIPIALPAFDQFEVDHLSEWLEYTIRIQLKKHCISEQEIRYCSEKLMEKIRHFEGRLPETYEVLRESLEVGGMF